MVTEFTYSLIMSADNPLAKKDVITFDDLTDYIEIAHADPYVPSMPFSKVVKEELPDNIDRRIFIFERASQFDLLSLNSETFMWVSPAPQSFVERYNLVLKKCADNKKVYKDVLDNLSYFGRIFARSGGLSDAVAQGLKEQNIEFNLKAIPCEGIEECRIALLKKSKNVLDANCIEGMACIGGAGCLTHGEKNKAEVDKYGREALEKTISDATAVLK